MIKKEKGDVEKSTNVYTLVQIVFLVLVAIAIGCMISAIITIHNYADMLRNPVGYNLGKFGIESCSYINNAGELVVIPAINSS